MYVSIILIASGLPDELKSTKRFKRGDGTAKPANGDASMAYEEKEKIVLEGWLLIISKIQVI